MSGETRTIQLILSEIDHYLKELNRVFEVHKYNFPKDMEHDIHLAYKNYVEEMKVRIRVSKK